MSETFSAWCTRCVAGDYDRLKHPAGGHQEHRLSATAKGKVQSEDEEVVVMEGPVSQVAQVKRTGMRGCEDE